MLMLGMFFMLLSIHAVAKMCTCLRVYMLVYICLYVNILACFSMFAFINASAGICLYVYVYVKACIHASADSIFVCLYTCLCWHINMLARMHSMHAGAGMYQYFYVHSLVLAFVHASILVCITCRRVYTLACINACWYVYLLACKHAGAYKWW